MQRRLLHYSGHVQGVGFRYTTQKIARRFTVTGYVRNLRDGRVELVAEAPAAELDSFLNAVQDALQGHIRDSEERRAEATGEFDGFAIRG